MPHRRTPTHYLSKFALISLGAGSAFFGLKGFLVPNHLIDGGVTGVAMLLASMTEVGLPWLLILINLPFVAWAFRRSGAKYGLTCMGSIFLLAAALQLISIEPVTKDTLLAAVFGGFFIGAGMGLTIRGGGVLDGTEILALFVERQLPFSLGDIVLFLNVIIFVSAAGYLGIEPALYSIITYWSAVRTAEFVLSGIEEYNAVLIISAKNDEIREEILSTFNRGVTIIKARGGFNLQELEILYCLTTRLELPTLRGVIRDIDADAFFVSHRIDDASGGLTKRILARN